jgi:hypothetical protein
MGLRFGTNLPHVMSFISHNTRANLLQILASLETIPVNRTLPAWAQDQVAISSQISSLMLARKAFEEFLNQAIAHLSRREISAPSAANLQMRSSIGQLRLPRDADYSGISTREEVGVAARDLEAKCIEFLRLHERNPQFFN